MSTIARRGFTLVELLVAVVLLGVVTAGIYRTLVTNQRTYHAQVQRIDLQQNIRAAVTVLPAEFRELDAADGDITAMSATSITIRAMRQLEFLCALPVLDVGLIPGPMLKATTLTLANQPRYGSRDIDPATDSILVYYEGDEGTRTDDGWVIGDIAVPVGNANCPAPDNRPARTYAVRLFFGPNQWSHTNFLQSGAPVRGFQSLTYLLYQASDGRYYIGQRSTVAAVERLEPIIGPVTANGLTFTYFDAAGAVTADRLEVASIEIRVRGETAKPVSGPGGGLITPVDSVVTHVALRNNPRW